MPLLPFPKRICYLFVALSTTAVAVLAACSSRDPANSSGNEPRGQNSAEGHLDHGSTRGMVWIPGGEFDMGSNEPMFSDARPVHRVRVSGFWIDETEVTNAEFRRFIRATGYVTLPERPLDAREFPHLSEAERQPGSFVFSPPARGSSLSGPPTWWVWTPGANWLHPEGPQSDLRDKDDHPVVHITYEDALAYANWSGKALPTEAQWEYAARGGLVGQPFVWGSELQPNGRPMANTFQGDFPGTNSMLDGYATTSPVRAFPANAYGLYGMSGNVWEWTSDWYRPDYYSQLERGTMPVMDPLGPSDSFDPSEPGIAKKVQKGGSFLCTDQYCGRYRPGARGKGDPFISANHIGFRLVRAELNPKHSN